MQPVLSAAHFHNEEAAYEFVEARLWPAGPICPHCGATTEHVGRLRGKTNRPGLYKCYACRAPFTVKIGTVFESSHVPMRIWLQAIYLFCSSKKGISTRQLQRTFNCGMKTAWFLGHRVREAMHSLGLGETGLSWWRESSCGSRRNLCWGQGCKPEEQDSAQGDHDLSR